MKNYSIEQKNKKDEDAFAHPSKVPEKLMKAHTYIGKYECKEFFIELLYMTISKRNKRQVQKCHTISLCCVPTTL